MPWFYVDDAFADSKPVMQLDRSLRNEAIGLWVRCGAWSAKEETDGRVPLDTVKSFDGTPRLIRALHDQAGLWVESSPESWRNSREILFGNWEKWQKTRAENVAKRKADAERQSNHRKAKKGRNYIPETAVNSGYSDGSRRDSQRDGLHGAEDPSKEVSRCESQRPDPDPTRPDPLLLVTSGGGVTSVDANDPRPECPRHATNHDGPCRACKRRQDWDDRHEGDVLRTQLEAKRLLREQALACPRCRGTNNYEVAPNTVAKCDPHLPPTEVAHA